MDGMHRIHLSIHFRIRFPCRFRSHFKLRKRTPASLNPKTIVFCWTVTKLIFPSALASALPSGYTHTGLRRKACGTAWSQSGSSSRLAIIAEFLFQSWLYYRTSKFSDYFSTHHSAFRCFVTVLQFTGIQKSRFRISDALDLLLEVS